MNLGEIITQASIGIDRDDLVASMGDYVRAAALQIQKEHSWRWMRQQYDFFLFPTDSASWPLPDGFKELVSERESLSQVAGTPEVMTPWTVYAAPQGSRLNAGSWSARQIATFDYALGNPTLRFPILQPSGGGATDIHLRLFYYGFLPPLRSADQTNVLTNEHNLMLINKTKAIAFEAINDPVYQEFEGIYELYKNKDVAYDMQADLSGRTRVPKDILQMARRRTFDTAANSSSKTQSDNGGQN